jgi:hypothetical protein
LAKLDQLNDPPLMERLRLALEFDGLSLTQGEFAVLRRLRAVRNPAQHGTTPPLPDDDDLIRGWSIIARMLVYRAAARLEE